MEPTAIFEAPTAHGYRLIIQDQTLQVVGAFQITKKAIVIGRASDCDIVLDSPDVSRRHTSLSLLNGFLEVEDLGSTGGTWLLESHVGQQQVGARTIVALGSVNLKAGEHRRVTPGTILVVGAFRVHVAPHGTVPGAEHKTLHAVADSPHARLGGSEARPPKKEPPPPEKGGAVQVEVAEVENPDDALHQRYEMRKLLGEGSFGEIWVAQEKLSRRFVALKLLKKEHLGDQRLVDQFVLESLISARLQHPHILPVYDLGFLQHNQVYYTMRLVEGPRMQDLLAASLAASQRRSITLLTQAASAVAHAHKKHLMHLDLKPDNLLIDENDYCYVTDWGLIREIPGQEYDFEIPRIIIPKTIIGMDRNKAHQFREEERAHDLAYRTLIQGHREHQQRQIAGTPLYMAPEQAQGRPGPESDLWAFGLMLYEVLAGAHPYRLLGVPMAVLSAIAQIDRIPSVAKTAAERGLPAPPPELAQICERALRQTRDPFTSMQEFVDALRVVQTPATASKMTPERRMELLAELAVLPFTAFGRRRAIRQALQQA